MVGIVLVSHSAELARGLAQLAAAVAGSEVHIEPAGGDPEGGLGTSGDLVNAALDSADTGDGVVALGDLGSAFLILRGVLEERGTERVRLVDAPFVEGAVAAAVVASAGGSLADVARAAEQARGVGKL